MMPFDDLGPVKVAGLKFRVNADRSRRYYWMAPTRAVALGYLPKMARVAGDDSEEAGRDAIRVEAERLMADALRWLDERETGGRFDGTLGALVRQYQTDPASPYAELKWNTRRTYDQTLALIDAAFGKKKLAGLGLRDFRSWYAEAKKPRLDKKGKPMGPERVDRAHRITVILRRLFSYGVAAEIADCPRLTAIMNATTFRTAKPHRDRLTLEYVQVVIKMALEKNRLSLALGTATQFESTFRQRDVIGEWEPIPPGEAETGIVLNGRRWVNGLRWGEVAAGKPLVKETTKTGAIIAHDFSLYPLMMNLIRLVPPEKRVGPFIIDETAGRPYAEGAYAREWRTVADAAGIPRSVWNMHARAGGISEADEAGATLEEIGHQTGQSQTSTTARYVRGTVEKTRKVARLRLNYRARHQGDGEQASNESEERAGNARNG
jgi:hypothetical protein